MKKFISMMFESETDEKIKDSTIVAAVFRSVFVIFACLVAMSLTAYAYFTHNVASEASVVKAANFGVDVIIRYADSENNEVTELRSNGDPWSVNLPAGAECEVTLTGTGTASTGYCIMSLQNGETNKYFSRQLGVDVSKASGTSGALHFELKVHQPTVVTFAARWGTSSHYTNDNGQNDPAYITDGDVITIGTASKTDEEKQSSEESAESTEPTQTTEATESARTTEPTQATEPTEPSEDETLPQETLPIETIETSGANSEVTEG